MGTSHETRNNKLDKIARELEKIDKKTIEVGVFQGEQKWLAHIHEFGCDITVTPKMRAYLHRQGLHLKENTTRIRIPERSFLRSGYDENRSMVLNHGKAMLADVAGGTMSADEMFKGIGQELSRAIKDYAVDLRDPANHPFTTGQKGSSNPLVDSGDMIGGITYRVVNK